MHRKATEDSEVPASHEDSGPDSGVYIVGRVVDDASLAEAGPARPATDEDEDNFNLRWQIGKFIGSFCSHEPTVCLPYSMRADVQARAPSARCLWA